MRKTALVLFLIMLAGQSHAQQSVGFENNSNIEPILKYRLPSWGYHRFFINFSTSGGGDESKDVRLSFNLNPTLDLYHESESSIWNIHFVPSINYNYDESSKYANESRIALDLEGSLRKYISNSTFFDIGGDFNGTYYNHWGSEHLECGNILPKEEYTHYAPYIGIGIGKIRDVTPLFMAMRMNERLKALGGERELSAEQIQRIAQTIAKRNGYISVHDRSDKYFWRDLFDLFEGIDRQMSAFDYYYLSEATIERPGSRMSGWDLSLRLGLSKSLNKWECEPRDSKSAADASIVARWTRNLNLDHRLGLRADVKYTFSLDKKASDYMEGYLDIRAEHLWVISDRLLLDTNLRGIVMLKEAERYFYGWYARGENYMLDVDFSYFVEDNLSIISRFEIHYYPDTPSSDPYADRMPWSYNIGFQYYPWRKLS